LVRVLLVEDNHDMLMMVSETLRLDDYEVLEASNGKEALVLLQAALEPPHIVITDVKMPLMDGWQLLAAIRGHPAWADLPCLVLSGEVGDGEKAEGHGANGFLLKPFRHQELVHMIDTLLQIQ